MSILSQIQSSSSSIGSGLDIQAIVNATINASSGKLNKLKDTQKNNDTIIAADSSVRDKIEAARVAYSKVTAAASAQTPNVDDITHKRRKAPAFRHGDMRRAFGG